MFTFDSLDEIEKAAERAKKSDKKLKISMQSPGQYQVTSGRDETVRYDVACGRLPNGKKFASCGCIAGETNKVCKHAAVAIELHVAVMKVKQMTASA
jgi:hypothetical protein